MSNHVPRNLDAYIERQDDDRYDNLEADAEDSRLADYYDQLDDSHHHHPCPVCGVCTICEPHLHVGRNQMDEVLSWDTAIRDAKKKIEEVKTFKKKTSAECGHRIRQLNRSVEVFTELRDSGFPWPERKHHGDE